MHTRASIRRLLNEPSARGVRAVKRAIIRLDSFQTQDERRGKKTKYLNARGFSVATVKRGSELAALIRAGRYLTSAEVTEARTIALHHAQQLADFANNREERRAIQSEPLLAAA